MNNLPEHIRASCKAIWGPFVALILVPTLCFGGQAFDRHPPMKATYEDTVPAWLCLDYDSSFLFNPPVSEAALP